MAKPPEFPPETSVAPEAARFSVWHALGVFIAGVIGGLVGFSIGIQIAGDQSLKVSEQGAFATFCGFAGQFGAIAAGLWIVSRLRGSGSWARDSGLALRANDGWALFAGLGLQVAFIPVLLLLTDLVNEKQGVVEQIEDASGAKLAVLAVFAGLVAPVLEELLFRGLLLRSLQRKMSAAWAIATSAIAFGVIHVLLDPTLGTLVVVPGLIVMGAISAIFAVRSGNLSQSILFHIGFNLLAVVGALFA
jgi:membrane protease YdiL (CAAX protease family)